MNESTIVVMGMLLVFLIGFGGLLYLDAFVDEEPEEEVVPIATSNGATFDRSGASSLETSLFRLDSLVDRFIYLDDLMRVLNDSLKVYEDKNKLGF